MKEEQISVVQLFSSIDDYQIKQICELLEQNNIPFIKKDDGSGAYMNLYMGKSIQEKRIFVNDNDYKNALELISTFIVNDDNIYENNDEIEQEENETKKYQLTRRLFGLLILGIPILVMIILIVMSNIAN